MTIDEQIKLMERDIKILKSQTAKAIQKEIECPELEHNFKEGHRIERQSRPMYSETIEKSFLFCTKCGKMKEIE